MVSSALFFIAWILLSFLEVYTSKNSFKITSQLKIMQFLFFAIGWELFWYYYISGVFK